MASGDDHQPVLDEVYADRNLLAQLAAKFAADIGMPVGMANDPAEPGWPIIYIELPTGQVSWHVPADEVVERLTPYHGVWDGHSTEEKLARIQAFLTVPEESAHE